MDRVLPSVPMRQYVYRSRTSCRPWRRRACEVLAKLCRVFWESVRGRYRRWAKGAGYTKAETGAVSATQRFGSSLNLHAHIHSLVVDGVFTEEKGVLHFVPAPAPTREELAGMLVRIHSRVVKWLERKGYVRDADESNAPLELSPIEALASAGTQRGTLVTVRETADAESTDEPSPMHRDTDAVTGRLSCAWRATRTPSGSTSGATDPSGAILENDSCCKRRLSSLSRARPRVVDKELVAAVMHLAHHGALLRQHRWDRFKSNFCRKTSRKCRIGSLFVAISPPGRAAHASPPRTWRR